MTLDALLHACARLGVKMALENGSLRVRAPAGAVTPELRAALALHKPALLAQLAAPHDEIAPLSLAQRSLWLLHQGEPASLPAYNIRAARRFRGPLDAARLERALAAVVARHEPLRTAFYERDGEPWQRIAPAVPVRIQKTDIPEFPAADAREAAWRARLDAEGRRAFDLRTAPLFAVELVRLAPDEHVLLLNAHHLIADAWSAGLILRELADAYAKLATAGELSLAQPAYRFSDHVQVQQRAGDTDAGRAALAYWQERLAGLPALQLPADFSPANASDYAGSSEEFTLDPAVAQALRALARAEGVTLFHALIASFAVLLRRLSGQDDFGIGTTLAGRDTQEAESLIGYFVNLVVLRWRLDDATTFRALLREARMEALGAFQHQAASFDQIVHALRLPRERGVTPLFQVLFLYLQASRDAASFAGLEVEALPVPSTTSKYDLSLHVEDHGERLGGLIEYNTARFAPETIRRFIATWQALLRGLAAAPDTAVARVTALDEATARRVLNDFNAHARPVDFAGGIAAAIGAQAKRTPDAVALAHEERSLSYAQLDAAAEGFAARLRAAGVGPERLVGVCVERSPEMMIALLAILKAGGAYVPLDPAYPAERLGFMVADAKPIALLTQKRLVAALPAHAVPRIFVDGIADASGVLPASASIETPAQPAQVAYVIYTSGSTGRPKGVMVTQSNVMNFFAGMDAQLGPARGTWLALTSISFDISVLELFWTLARGFKVVLQSDEPKSASATVNPVSAAAKHPLDFSLFYFSGDALKPGPGKYRLLLEGAKFADANGFAAVWTPERHFHAFGGLFPNPSVIGGALAMATQRVAIRAGSVVLPLHDPVRVAEEWATVDNLSGGRAGVSFASGWHPQDFTLAPQHYAERRRVLVEHLAQVRALWRGETVPRTNAHGETTGVRTLPRPLQPELPAWITAGRDPETFRLAGEVGAGLLTHLLGQSPDELGEKIARYRQAWRAAGHAGEGQVTVMLHTFIGDDLEAVRARVRGPFREYLRTSVDLIAGVAKTLGLDLRAPGFTADDFEAVLDHAFERYFETSALMGTPASVRPLLEKLRAMSVNEIGCLIDFGVDEDAALAALAPLAALKDSLQPVEPRCTVAEQFARHAPTHLQATPSGVKMLLLDPPVAAALAGLERLVVGGEALPQSLATELTARVRGEVHNLYGPTETTVWSTGHRVARGETAVRIGRPLANQQAYVLDRHLLPVPVGVTGELYLGGEGVTRGYLGRPELTAERFVPDPFGATAGGRLYRTGDLARWNDDGVLECLGRADDQVKILGHRIEPGEIESMLARHPAVHAAAVTAPVGPDGARRLVGYVVAKPDASPKTADLRAWLHERLPDYLVPGVIVFLPALPLTPNGKIDRRALPAPETAALRVGAENEYVAPRTPAERLVADVWAQLLALPRVGAHDNFFEIGGHSLLAMQMIARLRQAAGVELPLRSVFDAPTVAGVAERLALPAANAPASETPALVRVPRDGRTLPLSFGQRRLWFIEQLEPGRSTYHMPAAIRLRGRCDAAALEASFTDLVRRHEALRTRFPAPAGEPFQEIVAADACAFALAVEDLRVFPAGEREGRAKARAADEVAALFDLARGPLLRARLLRLDDEDHLLVFVIHHIVSDGWTMGLLTRELTTLYAARAAGTNAALPALAAHYADFAAWQRSQLTEETLRAPMAFWRNHLAGGVAAEIPGDHPRPRMLDGHGREYRFAWPAELTGALQRVAQREGATLFMTLLAGYYALLARYTRQEDLVVGTSVANRPRPEFEAMAGFFVNVLPVRVDTSGNPTFVELLARVKQACLAGYAHQDTPFELLIDAVAPGRDLSRTPIFQTMLVLLNTPLSTARLAGLEIAPVPLENRTAKFDVTLLGEEVDGQLRWVAEYRTELYREATIARLAEHLQRLLAGAAASPDERLFALPMLSPQELDLQRGWNRTAHAFPRGRWVHEFPADAAPEATALVFAGQGLTYREFNARTDALAAVLAERGVGPESLVAVFLERSIELVVALHAIMKAGGAYVPLDPGYPAERIAYMLEDANAAVVLTASALAPRLSGAAAGVLRLDTLPAAAATTRAPVRPALHGESAAYMIYTSGSTGRPKGAVNTHAGILNRLQWMQDALPLTPVDRVLQKTPYSFDVSVWEFFWPLMTGATLVVAEPEAHKDPARLVELIVAERITTLHFVPSMLRAFLESPGVERCASLRQVICSGEELPRDLARICQEKLPAAALHNLYGPTEAAVDVTWHACARGANGPVPIGRPIANIDVHVLDPELQPVPVGVAGEVYLGGVGLGRGYHAQPALTAERWVPHPHAAEPGARLYRTGDLGRWLASGEIEYLGRVDFQVKLRGFRIELGEIDAALRAHPQIADAACALRNDAPGGARLVGYVVARETPPTAAELRTWLGGRLPDYMVPAAWVFLDALPLSPAGKIDRRALPAPLAERPAERVLPRDADEAAVAAIWSEVLARGDIGATDDFFALGGHSLIATQVMTRLSERCGVTLPLRILFEQPTVELFAAAVRIARVNTAPTAPAPVLRRTNRERRKVTVQADGEIGAVELARRES